MNILYIGQVVPIEKIKECSAYSIPGDMFQKNLILGLKKYVDTNIYVISSYPNASWPHEKLFIEGENDIIADNVSAINISYINIPLFKQLSQERAFARVGYKIAKEKNIDLIMVYNMYTQFGGSALKLSRKLKKPLVAILADFPNDNNKLFGGKDSFWVKCINALTWRNIEKLKYAIVLNENAKKYMAKDGEVLVVPGGVNNLEGEELCYKSISNRDVIYAGALTKYSGVLNLIEAINNIKINDICLKIYGNGPLKEEIIRKQSEKVCYKGNVSIDEMRKILEKSWILVNPRSIDDFVSSVTFPSKLFEYIMCGRPVISTEFKGIPKEIKEMIWNCKNGTPEELQKSIEQIYNMNEKELEKKVRKSYFLLQKEYSWKKNSNRIQSFCKSIVTKSEMQ